MIDPAAPPPTLVVAVIAFINNLPAILGAIGGIAAAVLAIRNGRKTDRVAEKADLAAGKAEEAVTKAIEVHETTKKVESNTNGYLTGLASENAQLRLTIEGLQGTIITLSTALNARQVRKTDVIKTIAEDVHTIAAHTEEAPSG